MSQKIYENHGKAALLYSNPTQLSGRYFSQKTDERNILMNIAAKLELVSTDKCLDIGCGVGNILIPMSFLVETITGIDHPNCLNFLKNRYDGENIKLGSSQTLRNESVGEQVSIKIEEGKAAILVKI